MLSRSSTTTDLFQENFVEVPEFKPSGKLPSGTIVIGRMLHLCKKMLRAKPKVYLRERPAKWWLTSSEWIGSRKMFIHCMRLELPRKY